MDARKISLQMIGYLQELNDYQLISKLHILQNSGGPPPLEALRHWRPCYSLGLKLAVNANHHLKTELIHAIINALKQSAQCRACNWRRIVGKRSRGGAECRTLTFP